MASEMLGGWFGSSVVGKLINLAFDYAEGQFIWQTGMKAELKRLQFLQPRVEAVVAASSRVHDLKNRNKALYNWLQQLQDAIDDADDALDELEYLRIKEQLREEEDGDTEAELNQVSYTVSSIQQSLIRFGNRALERDPVLLKLKGALENLDRVFSGVAELNQLVDWVKQEQLQQQIELTLNRETGSYPTSDLIGHEEDVAHIIQWLRSSDPEEGHGSGLYGNISLLSIVGIGGMGKTTLLQHVYHKDDIIKQELHFDCKMWACISNIFDVKRVLSDMLESLTGGEKPNLGSLDAHQRRLNAGVSSKKFLLVLDDAWEELNSEEIVYLKKWETLLAPLCGGKKGSKILLTTRMESVARLVARTMNRKQEMIWKLKGLKDGEIELLLNSHAFAGIDNINDYPKLKFIANQIAKKLHGSPLGAKVIGGALRSNMDERHWMYILSSSSSIWDTEPVQKGIMSILRLSYDFLPTQLQRCFAFCSVFKQDHQFNKNELVRMWVALGFIQQFDSATKTIDDVGINYFNYLFQRSFFERKSHSGGYVMHDMLHDLAMLAANGKCQLIIGDELHSFATPDNVRHLAIVDCSLSIMNKVKKGCKRLHSLLLHVENEGFNDAFHEFVCKDLKRLKSLRLLQIDAPYMTTLPDVFGHMIHLRYLDISYTKVTHLPKSICLLYHLQVLSIVHAPLTCSYQLPKDINHLTKLRYLDFPRRLINGMFRIGKLTVLQELDGFNVKDEDGCRIGELKHMNQLQKLSVFAIEKVKEKDEASLTKLVEKQHLTTLSLNWWSASTNNCYIQNGGGCDLDEEVFDRLQPPKSLKQLTIAAYRGIRSAVWMKPHLITNLESITLSDCLGWEGLPPLSQLPFLKSLCLRNMPQVKCLGQKIHGECENSGFPSLEKLDIVDLISLHDWFQMGENVTPSHWFPRLQQLRIHGCPKLRDIPSIPLSLVKFSIYNVGIVNFPGHDDNISSDNKNYLSMSSKLSRIEIVKCVSITTFPSIEVLQRFVALKVLRIDGCKELMSLEGLQALRSLEFLIIYDCQKLTHHEVVEGTKCSSSLQILELANLSTLLSVPYKSISTLQSLKIHRFEELACFPEEVEWWLLQNHSLHCLEFISLKSLKFLPTCLSSLYSLNHLKIQTLPLLEKLPELPASLQYLFLSDLDSLHLAPTCLHSCLSLTDLRITKIPSIKTLPDFPRFLQRLKLNDLASLSSLPSSIHNLSSLKYLTIHKIPLLEELPDLPPFLKYLELEELEALQSLPSCFSELSFLLDLVLTGISQIQILPDLPLSIQVLRINKPHPVLKERCQRNVGLDWPKIAHIYHVSIST